MAWRRKLAHACAAASLAIGPHGGAAAYSTFYVFGDSLTDSGNVLAFTTQPGLIGALLPDIPGAPYFDGRFTNGYNFADVVNLGLFGQPLTPFLAGGINYAVGGATTGLANAVIPTGGIVPPTGVLAQIGYYVSAPTFSGADPNALYLVYGGANDLFSLLEAAAQNPANASQLRNQVLGSATVSFALSLGVLAEAGANHFLLPNLPDLGQTPRYYGTPLQAPASLVTQELNTAFDLVIDAFALAYRDNVVVRLDVHGLFNDAVAAPDSFGFTEIRTPCYSGSPFGGAAATVCVQPEQYLFWDDIHPTAAAHLALGEAALQALAIPEPTPALLLLSGLAVLGLRLRSRRW